MKKISIPEPCHENWGQMSPEKQGRHCGVCDKVVVDFSKKSTPEIIDYLESTPGKTCGRFRKGQLSESSCESKSSNAEVLPELTDASRYSPIQMAMPYFKSIAASVLALVGTESMMAQGDVRMGKVSYPNADGAVLEHQNLNTVELKGKVESMAGNKISKAKLSFFNQGKLIGTVMSDDKGSFDFNVEPGRAKGNMVTVKIQASGYETKILNEMDLYRDRIKLKIRLKAESLSPDMSSIIVTDENAEYNNLLTFGYVSLEPQKASTPQPLEGLPTPDVIAEWKSKVGICDNVDEPDNSEMVAKEPDCDYGLMGDSVILNPEAVLCADQSTLPLPPPSHPIEPIELIDFEMGDVAYVGEAEIDYTDTNDGDTINGVIEPEIVEEHITMGLPALIPQLIVPEVTEETQLEVTPAPATSIPLEKETDKKVEQGLSFILYPNPAQDIITVRPSWKGKATYQLLNADGAIIDEGQIRENEEKLSVENLSSGTYLIRINHSSGLTDTQRFIKN